MTKLKLHDYLLLSLFVLLLSAACSGPETPTTESNVEPDSQTTLENTFENQAPDGLQNSINIQTVESSIFQSGNLELNIWLDRLNDESYYLGMLTGLDGSHLFLPCRHQPIDSSQSQLLCGTEANLAPNDYDLEIVTIDPDFAEYVLENFLRSEPEFITQIVAYWDSWSACKAWATNDRKPDYMDGYCGDTYPEMGWAFTDPDDIWLDLQDQDGPFNCLCFGWPYVEDIVEDEIPVTYPEGYEYLCNFTSNTFGLEICPTVWDLNGDYLILPEDERDPFNSPGYLYQYAGECFASESSPCCTEDNKTMLKYLYCSTNGRWYENEAQFGDEEYYLEETCISQEHYDLANQCIQYNNWQYSVQVNTENELITFYRYLLENYVPGQWITPCKDFVEGLWDCTYEFEYVFPPGWENYSSMVAPDCDGDDGEGSSLCQPLAEDDPINNLAAECADEVNVSEYRWPYTQHEAISILGSYLYAKPTLEPSQAPMCKIYFQFADFLYQRSTGDSIVDLFIGNVPHFTPISNQIPINLSGPSLSNQDDRESDQNEPVEDRCAAAKVEGTQLVVVGFSESSDPFITYLKFPELVPGTNDSGEIVGYSAVLGDLPETQCTVNSLYPDRLYCSFDQALSLAGTAKPFEVRLESCDDPIFQEGQVSVVLPVQEEPTDQDSCIKPDPPSADLCYQWNAEKCAWECIN